MKTTRHKCVFCQKETIHNCVETAHDVRFHFFIIECTECKRSNNIVYKAMDYTWEGQLCIKCCEIATN